MSQNSDTHSVCNERLHREDEKAALASDLLKSEYDLTTAERVAILEKKVDEIIWILKNSFL